MKKFFIPLLAACLVLVNISAAAAGVSLSAFPDPVFREYLKQFDSGWFEIAGYDEWGYPIRQLVGNDNGILDDKELEVVGAIFFCNDNISSLEGIRHLTYLRHMQCENTKLTEIDVSGLKNLETLICPYNSLTKINISGCTVLEYLRCNNNKLTVLNLNDFSALVYLECEYNNLTELNLNGCTALTELYCYDNKLTELDLSSCSALKFLKCYNNQLAELDLSSCSDFEGGIIYPQFINELKVKKTSEGYEVNLKDYVSKLENIGDIWGDDSAGDLITYDKATGIALFSSYPKEIYYYHTHSPIDHLMYVTIKSPMGISVIKRENEYNNLFDDMNDNSYLDSSGNAIKENDIVYVDLSAYSKKGFAADGNSRLILRVQTETPGTITFSFNDDIGATLEQLTDQTNKSTSSIQINTTEINSEFYQTSAVLVAPETFPNKKNFPSDKFKINVQFTPDDPEEDSDEENIELKIEAAPVVLIHGLFDNSAKTFGIGRNDGIYQMLKRNNFREIDIWNYDSTQGYSDVLDIGAKGLYHKLEQIFSKYFDEKIVCTKADIVAFGVGGLVVEKYLLDTNKSGYSRNNWSFISYKQGMVRRLITIATPHYGTPWADILLGAGDILQHVPQLNAFGAIMNFTLSKILGTNILVRFKDILSDLKTSRNAELPSDVLIHAIYGDVSGSINNIQKFWDTIDLVTGSDQFISMAGVMALTQPEIALAMLYVSLGVKASQIPGALINHHIFRDQQHDFVVAFPSAAGGLTDNAIDGHYGLAYRHSTICKQGDVGVSIAYLLKGYVNNFDVNTSSNLSTLSQTESVPIKLNESSSNFKFIEALKFEVTPTVFRVHDSQTVQIYVKTDSKENDYIYCAIGTQEGYKIFKMSDYGAKIIFTSQDTGIMSAFCFSRIN